MQGHGATKIPYLVIYTPDGKVGYRGPPHESSVEYIKDMYKKTEAQNVEKQVAKTFVSPLIGKDVEKEI
jgi:hypothetical protein